MRSGTVSANNRVADDYADFYDGTWQNSNNGRTESGAFQGWFTSRLWTGTNTNGTTHATRFMGASTTIRWRIQSGSITADHSTPSGSHNILALSPVFQVATTNNAPTAAHNTVTTVVDRPYTFEADDFGFVDTDTGDTLASVKIVTLPAVGTLAFDGTPVMQNDVVIWDDIEDDKLTFTPVAGASGTGYATFTFKVNDGTVDSASAYTMTIDVTDAPALACAAPDLAGRDRIWTGELTVGTIIGFGNLIEGYGFSSPSATGALNNRTFNTDRNGYTVDFVGVLVGGGNDGDFLFSPTSRLTAAEKAALRLHVCDTPYDFSDAALSSLVSSYDYTWAVGLDWSSISSRTLYLSLPEGYPEPPAAAPAVPTGLSAQSVSGKPGYLRLSWTPGRGAGRQLAAHPHRLRGPLPQDGRNELVADVVVPQLRDPGIRLPVNYARGSAGRSGSTAHLLPRPEHRVRGPGARDQLLRSKAGGRTGQARRRRKRPRRTMTALPTPTTEGVPPPHRPNPRCEEWRMSRD